MKKCIYTLLVPILAALALGSCESIVYDDEYSKDTLSAHNRRA